MKAKGGKWTYQDLFHFLHKPREFVPGTRMGFMGFNKLEDIADVVAYLRTTADAQAELPPVEKDEPAAAPASPTTSAASVAPVAKVENATEGPNAEIKKK